MALGQPGLSLIELLIVAATLLIMATIAIPNFLKPKMGANQAFAVGSLKMIVSGEVSCPATYSIGSSSALGVLDGAGIRSASASAGLIDIVLAPGKKSVYNIYCQSICSR